MIATTTIEEISIGDNKYLFDHSDQTLRRYNEKHKMWVRIFFDTSDGEDHVLNKLIKDLTDEHIQQCLRAMKKGPT